MKLDLIDDINISWCIYIIKLKKKRENWSNIKINIRDIVWNCQYIFYMLQRYKINIILQKHKYAKILFVCFVIIGNPL